MSVVVIIIIICSTTSVNLTDYRTLVRETLM